METKIRAKQKPSLYFSVKQKRKIIDDYLQSGKSKQQIWKEYTGDHKERGKMLKWMRQLGYVEGTVIKKAPSFYMEKKPTASKPVILPLRDEGSFKLQKLQQELNDSHLREQSYLLMIEVAERELKINIRKKLYTK
ncbi:hypothetical protein [Pedobacter sp. UYP1]|uniref:hypothetical protein n=1 Tax=Pedobacter sp. UYP1 TaxID=1756396 RepID=UPI00339B8F4A